MTGRLIPLRRQMPSAEQVSDAALVAVCAAGDQAALAVLYDRHHAQVWRFLGRLLGPGCADIDDMVQSTFVEVWRSAPRFEARSQVRSWILGISHNLARRHMRDGTRKRAAMSALKDVSAQSFEPESAWQDRLLLERLEAALQQLSPPLRAVFVLCDLEELKGVEAARVLGVRQGTVWRRLHDARKHLRRALQGEP